MTTTPLPTNRRTLRPRAIFITSAAFLAVSLLVLPALGALFDLSDEVGDPAADAMHFVSLGLLALAVLCFVIGCVALVRARATR